MKGEGGWLRGEKLSSTECICKGTRVPLGAGPRCFCHSIPEPTWAGNCKTFALLTSQRQQDPSHRVDLAVGCFCLPGSTLCCQNDIKEL